MANMELDNFSVWSLNTRLTLSVEFMSLAYVGHSRSPISRKILQDWHLQNSYRHHPASLKKFVIERANVNKNIQKKRRWRVYQTFNARPRWFHHYTVNIICLVLCRKVKSTEATTYHWKLLHSEKACHRQKKSFVGLVCKQIYVLILPMMLHIFGATG